MVQLGQSLGLTHKAGSDFLICDQVCGKEFHRYPAVELSVLGQEYLAHPPRSDRGGDPVMRECLSDQSPPALDCDRLWAAEAG